MRRPTRMTLSDCRANLSHPNPSARLEAAKTIRKFRSMDAQYCVAAFLETEQHPLVKEALTESLRLMGARSQKVKMKR